MGIGTLLARAGLMVALRRWWARHAGARTFAFAALYPTFLVPAYLLPGLLVIELHGVAPGAALAAWNPMFLLLPVCLLAPYALTRVFVRGKPWPARLSAAATVLGLVAVLYLALLEVSCRELGEDSPWLLLFCQTGWQGWGVLALAAAMHLAVVLWGVKVISAPVPVAEEEATEREEVEREVSAGGAAPGPADGGIDENGKKAASESVWRRSAAWAQQAARRGAAGASSSADALRERTARPRAAAAAAARTAKRRVAAAWRVLAGTEKKRGGAEEE